REELAPERAAALYDELVALLVAMRRDLRAALDATAEPLPSLERDAEDAPDVAAEVAAARASRAEALATLDRLAWEHVEALAEALHDGNDIRLTLLERLPSVRADALQTLLHDEGRAQLRRELSQLELMSRYAVRHVRRTAPGWPAAILALGREPRSRRDLFALFALLGVVVFAFRRRLAFVDALEETSTQRIDSRRMRRVAQAWFARLRVGAGPLILLAGSGVAFALVLDIRHTAEVELLRTLVLAFLAYRLFVRLLHHELTRGPVRRIGGRRIRVRAPTARSQRVLFDVRRVGRYFFALVVTLGAAQRVVGEGTLYAQLVRVFVLVGLVLAYVLLRRWRDDIARAFAESHPDSRLGSRLADASGLRLDALAAVAAVELGVRRALEALRTFVVRFAAGRRAMAMLSRRRLEQRQAAEPEAEEPPEPREKPQLAEAFPLGPAPLESCLDRFPELDAITELVRRVSEGGRGAAVALVGEAGAGKTTWLRALVDRTEARTWCLEAPPAAHDQSILCRWLSEQLELPETESPARLAQEIEEAELRGLICVDAGENLFLRCIGGTEGFRALGEIVGRTQEQLVWVCAFSANGWRYLRAAEAGQSLFGRVVSLEGWSEEEIADLVERRMRKLGLRADFGALLDTGSTPGTALAGPARQRALERTREEFFRLLWDATDGNPRLVAHFWLRSLQRDEETGDLRVRLFEAPSPSELEALHDESRFLLAAVVVHEDLSAGEAALVLRWPIARCAALLDVLAARGFLMEEEERPGRFRISVQWFRAILRHLRRRRLLPPA
ncbi:MAG TPA: hypothetical protein RMH80_26860, partial [Polyangiaceae bacterium LLY-WYZ-15_(1-7)]|nr:hypothetical protein [Polyangiaceae bacterium LLY-WYZ-15_(1-7)]